MLCSNVTAIFAAKYIVAEVVVVGQQDSHHQVVMLAVVTLKYTAIVVVAVDISVINRYMAVSQEQVSSNR